MIEITPHPDWVKAFLEFIAPYQERVVKHKVFDAICKRKLTEKQFHGALINFYPLIESFPQYMALSLTKVPAGNSIWSNKTRYWLITNINQERRHTGWWRHFAKGFGVSIKALDEKIYPPPEMDAINNYLWRVCTHGSLAEGISASNLAVEGATGEWTKSVKAGIEEYRNLEWTHINEKTLEWIVAHANYDDHHPVEALEIIKAYATTKQEQEKVKQAAKRSLEYYALALDACYEVFK
jgi:pyrroloquinoline quinone (PQQ) biosynthesis protein C